MKIIIVGPAYPLRGGIADTNEALCRALLAQGHEASLVSFSLQYPPFLFPGKTQFSTDPAPQLTIDSSINSINPLNWIRIGTKLKAQKPDIVIFRYWIPFMGPALGTIARFLSDKTIKLALCDNVIPHEKRIGDQLFTKYFVNAFDGFISMSRTVYAELETFTSKPKIYFPHPINDNLGTLISKIDARRHLGLPEEGKYLLFFGLVRKYKGLDLMLEAMAQPEIKSLDIKLLIIGEFYDPIEEYQKIIDTHHLENQVIIRNEFIPSAEIMYYFSAADMVTQTYHTASQSGITQMAMHFNRPMLVTDVGGLSEVVQHNKSGYVTIKNAQEIAEKIIDFYTYDRFDGFSKQVERNKSKYSWEALCDATLALATQLKNGV